MAMKLLKKSEVQQIKAKERQKEVEEGLKLARRVDSLREIAAEEEKSLALYREKSISRIQEAINELIESKHSLQGEVEVLERQREEALAPLTALEERLNEQDILLQKEQASFEEEKNLFREHSARAQSELREYHKILATNEESLRLKEGEAEKFFQDLRVSESILADRQNAFKQLCEVKTQEFQATEARLEEREKQVAYKEADVCRREELVRLKEKEQKDKDVKLRVAYEALDITLKEVRLKHTK